MLLVNTAEDLCLLPSSSPSFSSPQSLFLSCCLSVCKWLLLLKPCSRTQNTSFHLQNINVPSPGLTCHLNVTALATSWDFPFIVWQETDWIILLPLYHHFHKDPECLQLPPSAASSSGAAVAVPGLLGAGSSPLPLLSP